MKRSDFAKKINTALRRLVSMILLCSLLLSFTIISTISSCCAYNKVHRYERYYEATEKLLDSLEYAYNWTDAYDFGAIYDEYVKARKEVQP